MCDTYALTRKSNVTHSKIVTMLKYENVNIHENTYNTYSKHPITSHYIHSYTHSCILILITYTTHTHYYKYIPILADIIDIINCVVKSCTQNDSGFYINCRECKIAYYTTYSMLHLVVFKNYNE